MKPRNNTPRVSRRALFGALGGCILLPLKGGGFCFDLAAISRATPGFDKLQGEDILQVDVKYFADPSVKVPLSDWILLSYCFPWRMRRTDNWGSPDQTLYAVVSFRRWHPLFDDEESVLSKSIKILARPEGVTRG